MQQNRSIPESTVIPILSYPDVREAVAWLSSAFGFAERLRIGENHRSQLRVGDGAVIVAELHGEPGSASEGAVTHAVMVRVADVNAHHARASGHGARIVMPPTDFPYGERQYKAEDLAGHRWTFSQTLDDIDPADWGGTLVDLPTPSTRER
jgi:uncharacterized glyoxalase superfamily protein PhnB